MAAFRLLLACSVLLVFPMFSDTLPEPGKLNMEFNTYDNFLGFSKALYKGATVSVKGTCSSDEKAQPKLTISWKLKYTQCADFFASVKENSQLQNVWDGFPNHEMYGEDTVQCNNHILLKDMSSQPERIVNETHPEAAKSQKDDVADEGIENKKRDDKEKQKKGKEGEDDEVKSNNVQANSNVKKHDKNGKKVNGKPGSRQGRSAEMKEETFRSLLRVKRDKAESNNKVPSKEKKQDKTNQGKKGGNTDSDNESDNSDDSGDKNKAAKNAPEKKDSESKAPKVPKNPVSNDKSSRLVVTRRDGIYLLIVTVTFPAEAAKSAKEPSFDLKLEVAMESKSGYLSATDWPLLPFYGIMSLVYLFYGIIWLIVSACQWRDLLRIQFWIGGVIALGMLEKAVFYSEYNNINNTGITTPSLVIFAEIVSVAKRTLARMLVIIVSMGFGIVKPRLGKSLHRVMGVGALYFIIGIVEGCLRSLSLKADPSKEQLIAGIPLAVLDAAICWWIFMSLVQTTRTLRIRRNVIKLSLYRHFTNTLIFAVLASVAYMIWSIKTHKFAECIKDWSELWLDEAFWHFLFSIILLVIMVLWRPTANNQRYAFTPIVDFDDDDEDNVTLSEAFDGMKMRNTRTEVIVNGDSKKKAEDDLKWVEENIPSSAADTVLPSVLDSDEELMTTKFEMSKME